MLYCIVLYKKNIANQKAGKPLHIPRYPMDCTQRIFPARMCIRHGLFPAQKCARAMCFSKLDQFSIFPPDLFSDDLDKAFPTFSAS